MHQKKSEPASALQRQKIRKQTAVEEIDGQGAAGDVRAAHMLISSRHSPDVVTGAMVLGTSLMLTLRCRRAGFERLVQPIRTPTAGGWGVPQSAGQEHGARS